MRTAFTSRGTEVAQVLLVLSTYTAFQLALDVSSRSLRQTSNPFYAKDAVNAAALIAGIVSFVIIRTRKQHDILNAIVASSMCYGLGITARRQLFAVVCACFNTVATALIVTSSGISGRAMTTCVGLMSLDIWFSVLRTRLTIEQGAILSAFLFTFVSFTAQSRDRALGKTQNISITPYVTPESTTDIKPKPKQSKTKSIRETRWQSVQFKSRKFTQSKVGMVTYGIVRAVIAVTAIYMIGILIRTILKPKLPDNYQLLAQKESNTGLISVVEDRHRMIRFLTSDYSVLGGMYVSQMSYGQSIYAQFHVQEAVRLTRKPGEMIGKTKGGVNGRVLVIGMGIGTVTGALIEHGCDVDAIEIDPVIVRFGGQFFWFRPRTVLVEDAVLFLRRARRDIRFKRRQKYDYVIHDVFTGGTIAENLISKRVLSDIASVMHPDGVLALNFVGDVANSCASSDSGINFMTARLHQVFDHVRGFYEAIDEDSSTNDRCSSRESHGSVQNIVFFASNVSSRTTFRPPTAYDTLGCPLRQETLTRFVDHPLSLPSQSPSTATPDGAELLRAQRRAARAHATALQQEFGQQLWLALAS